MSIYTFHHTKIKGLAAAVPESTWQVNGSDTGVKQLHRAATEQTASDLGFVAAKQLLEKYQVEKEEIACIIFASLTPDYRSPATAAVLQYRLGIPVDCIAYDLVLGATGFVSGLQKAASILESTTKQYALLVVADTNSKLMDDNSPAAGYLGDAGSAVLLEKIEKTDPIHLQLFTFSNEWESMSHKAGGFRVTEDIINNGKYLHANKSVISHLEVNQEAFEKTFNDHAIKSLQAFLKGSSLTLDQFDELLIQPLSFGSLNAVEERLKLPAENMIRAFEKFGNTSASAISVYLCLNKEKMKSGINKILGLSFGEGVSLAVVNFSIPSEAILPLIITDEVFGEGSVSHNF